MEEFDVGSWTIHRQQALSFNIIRYFDSQSSRKKYVEQKNITIDD